MHQAERYVRPTHRSQCAPELRNCPWCDELVTMRLAQIREYVIPDDEAESGVFASTPRLRVACPKCNGPVTYLESDDSWGWAQHDSGLIDSEVAERGVPHCRPCLFVGCREHLYADVNAHTGSIKVNFPDRDPEELEFSCALDLADEGGSTLKVVAYAMNLTPERVRQIELDALGRLHRDMEDYEL